MHRDDLVFTRGSCLLWKLLWVGVWLVVSNNVPGQGSGGDRQEDGESGTQGWERGVSASQGQWGL